MIGPFGLSTVDSLWSPDAWAFWLVFWSMSKYLQRCINLFHPRHHDMTGFQHNPILLQLHSHASNRCLPFQRGTVQQRTSSSAPQYSQWGRFQRPTAAKGSGLITSRAHPLVGSRPLASPPSGQPLASQSQQSPVNLLPASHSAPRAARRCCQAPDHSQ